MEEEEVEEEEDTTRINPGPVTNNLSQSTLVFQYPPNKSPPI